MSKGRSQSDKEIQGRKGRGKDKSFVDLSVNNYTCWISLFFNIQMLFFFIKFMVI